MKKSFSNITNDKRVYIDFLFLKNIDFSLFFNSSKNDGKWLDIFDLNSVINGLNSTDVYIYEHLSKFYLKILFQIYKKTQDKEVEKYINKLIIKLGFEVESSIIRFDDKFEILNEYLELLNLFAKEYFESFVNKLCDSYELRILLQLLSSTILEERKEFINNKLNVMIQKGIESDKLSFNDLKIGMLYAIDNDYLKLANLLEEIFNKKFNTSNNSFMKKFQKEFNEVVCKKDLLEILNDKDLETKEKFVKLNNYKIPIDDKNWGTESKYLKCENFKEFIRALIFFDSGKYDKAYDILNTLCEKELTTNYLINMVNSYFNLHKEDENKVAKFEYILNIFESKQKSFQSYINSIYEYQVLIYGYTITKNISKLSQLIKICQSNMIWILIFLNINMSFSKIIIKSLRQKIFRRI